MKWNVGDTLVYERAGIDPLTDKPYKPVQRIITAVRPTGYSWTYPSNVYHSEDSNDQFMLFGWIRKTENESH